MNVLFNNAGIMLPDETAVRIDDNLPIDSVTTDLMGPISMSSALIGHLKRQEDAVIVYTSSILGFVSLVFTAFCSATKAALRPYAPLQRFLLKGTDIRLLEWPPAKPSRPCRLISSSRRRWPYLPPMPTRSWWKVRGPSAPMSAPTNVLSSTPLTRKRWRLPKTADR
jgi:short-subunit dehydrogenase involved in D-alanine esterification of teichoic acids